MLPPYLPLPPSDRLLSPRTGWTRAHWEALADHLLEAVMPYASPGRAQFRLPGRASWSGVELDGLEGFARTFLAASFRIAGAGGDVPHLVERYAGGLAAGTDPSSGESWPVLTDRSQQLVEAASIAIGLHETRPWLWDRLDDGVRERVVDWLGGFVGKRTWDNNWVLFQTVTEEFLKSVGGPYEQREIDRGLERIEDWYVGDGWYTDGGSRNFDHYCGWALHLYPLLWTRMSGDAERAATYAGRLREFLGTYQHFFGSDGAPLHQGRSLTYRFAAVAPVWLGALADATPLTPGQTRRLASSVARHFAERGVPSPDGLLSLGWYEPFLPVTQAYSGPASPYWASKAFVGLLLPPDHPVWTECEQPLPIDERDVTAAVPAAGLLLHGTRHDGIVRLLNHGSDHGAPPDDPHYAKLAYSTRTAPEAAEHAWARDLDNHLALVGPDGLPSRRTAIRPLICHDTTASSSYETGTGAVVTTTSTVSGPWEVRVHEITGEPGGGTVREGGYALSDAGPPASVSGDGWALARRADGLTSAVIGLYGWERAEVAREVESNAFGPHSAIPCLHSGTPGLHVSLVVLSGDQVHPGALREAVTVAVSEEAVVVTFPGGTGATAARTAQTLRRTETTTPSTTASSPSITS
ncbi:DUF2264 domain-containing protein [Nonomuraea gerenzanensis]|uniref:DUF2264 domain-containing protein n=1 Tax=Nonomuraea gerenzanensis TaxID=93944 RepID=A0A1M4ELU8_9ACTN|nr:DUF2264 domain-containing protein [Nonomuraea gerenzanensis]UBU11327.1 DUF2264 domain-containing protein [Nonomuraea gerenzanensis]SBO99805.1 FIG01129393: hypothetical protein [Nonomuraea gerenzanensis]